MFAILMLALLFAMCECQCMMNLDTYLKQSGTSQRAFADEVGISPSFLNEILGATRNPGLATAQRIEAATGGEVPIDTWPNLAPLLAAARRAAP